jgi:phage gpG-like protein
MPQNPFEIPLQRIEAAIVAIKPTLIDAIGVEGLKFIDDNFRMQGYQGRSFIPWKIQQNPNKPRPHKILILNATLRRSFTKTDGPDSTTISTDIPYARVHNEGEFMRSRMGTFGKGHYMPQRQFLPITADDSPILLQRCEKVIIRKVTAALPK